MGKKRVLVSYGVDIDAVAGWLGSVSLAADIAEALLTDWREVWRRRLNQRHLSRHVRRDTWHPQIIETVR